jgi:histidyl-tRNA synthetase
MIDEVFKRLNINVVIKINNRKILAGIAEYIGAPEHLIAITVALDKLDKIGEEAVINEMIANGISTSSIEKLKPLLKVQNQNNADKLEYLKQFLLGLPIGMKGIEEMEEIFAFAETIKLQNKIQLDLTLARGLNYYTGAIFEVAALDVKMGSICGGGRYDNLTGIFGMPDVSGVGISFGADRIYDVLLELDGFPKNQMQNTSILIVNFGGSEAIQAMSIATALRNAGISCMLFPETIKIAKQFNFANVLQIPYVLIAGSNEVETGKLNLKDMNQGTQELLSIEQIIEKLQNN